MADLQKKDKSQSFGANFRASYGGGFFSARASGSTE